MIWAILTSLYRSYAPSFVSRDSEYTNNIHLTPKYTLSLPEVYNLQNLEYSSFIIKAFSDTPHKLNNILIMLKSDNYM